MLVPWEPEGAMPMKASIAQKAAAGRGREAAGDHEENGDMTMSKEKKKKLTHWVYHWEQGMKVNEESHIYFITIICEVSAG